MRGEHGSTRRTLMWLWAAARDGAPGLSSAERLARVHLAGDAPLGRRLDRMVRTQAAKAGVAGFASGFGGVLTAPVVIPACMAALIFVQLRLAAAMAHVGGHAPGDLRVRALGFACLLGQDAEGLLAAAGLPAGRPLTPAALASLPEAAVEQIEAEVEARLSPARVAPRNAYRGLPFVGNALEAGLDAAATRAVGRVARALFVGA